jgi:hypothetical protein
MHILIACETASIAAAMRDALRLGRELTGRGHRISYVMGDPFAFAEYGSPVHPDTALPAPLLREPPELILKRRPPSGFDDIMAISGFANSAQLQALAKSWATQLELLRPDAIVGFSSPLLWLVGPCFASTFAAGSGDLLPPAIGSGFPRLSASAPPLAADHAMIANANLVLQHLGAKPIDSLADLLERCQPLLYGLPWLDPHLQLRRQPSLGMLTEPPTVAPVAAKKRIAAVLDVFSPNIEALLLGLAGVDDIELEIFLAGATAGMTRFLGQHKHVSVARDFSDLASRLGQMSGLIHHGDSDLAEIAMALGVAQLTLPFLPHQQNAVGNFEWMGSMAKASPSDAIAANADMLKWFAGNMSLVVHAQHHARQMKATGLAWALPAIVDRIERAATPPVLKRDASVAASSL